MKFLLFFLCFNLCFCEILSLKELKNEPKSLAKDYYFYRLFENQKLSDKEFLKIKKEIFSQSGKLKKAYDKKFPVQIKKSPCDKFDNLNILDANASCQIAKCRPKFVEKLSSITRQILISKINNQDCKNLLLAYESPNLVQFFDEKDDEKNFFRVYFSNTQDPILDQNLSVKFLNKISQNKNFEVFLRDIVINKKFPNLSLNLTQIDATNLNYNINFLLGINAIIQNQPKKSIKFFENAVKISSNFRQDNAKFWLYLTKKDKTILQDLKNSENINIYSIYAREILGEELPKIKFFVPEILEPKDYNASNPFAWVRLKKNIDSLTPMQLTKISEKFFTKRTIGEYLYIVEKVQNYPSNFFATPFVEVLHNQKPERKALIYAIARQESKFINSAISTSYALGMMQFMPFLANDTAKQLKMKNFDQDFMFDPNIALEFANFHLDWLEKYLTNPVFIAYAYNGGINFTKKMLLRGDLFTQNKFEPFLSMELVPYEESRLYAKKVLANYIIYSKIFDLDIKISKVFENLTKPGLGENVRQNQN